VTAEAQDAPPDRMLNLGEAAALAQVDPNTLAKWAARGLVTADRARDGAWRKFSEAEMRALAPGVMITIGQFARLLRKHPKTVAKWADEGKLPVATRLPGGMRRFLEQDVHAFLKATSAEAEDGR
jgi:excisionase family DNA binding protein